MGGGGRAAVEEAENARWKPTHTNAHTSAPAPPRLWGLPSGCLSDRFTFPCVSCDRYDDSEKLQGQIVNQSQPPGTLTHATTATAVVLLTRLPTTGTLRTNIS
jgi:hypothetical protein